MRQPKASRGRKVKALTRLLRAVDRALDSNAELQRARRQLEKETDGPRLKIAEDTEADPCSQATTGNQCTAEAWEPSSESPSFTKLNDAL